MSCSGRQRCTERAVPSPLLSTTRARNVSMGSHLAGTAARRGIDTLRVRIAAPTRRRPAWCTTVGQTAEGGKPGEPDGTGAGRGVEWRGGAAAARGRGLDLPGPGGRAGGLRAAARPDAAARERLVAD